MARTTPQIAAMLAWLSERQYLGFAREARHALGVAPWGTTR